MRRRIPLGLDWMCLFAALIGAGCSMIGVSPGRNGAPSAAASRADSESLALSYRTDSDRLNVAAGLLNAGAQTAAFPAGGGLPLPALSTVQLRVCYPHPLGDPALALAVVSCEAQTAGGPRAAPMPWTRIVSGTESPTAQPPSLEVRSLDLAKGELEAILAKLRRDNFFDRSQILDAKAFVATEINGTKFGKRYRDVPELDALILRVRGQGRLLPRTAPAGGTEAADGPADWAPASWSVPAGR